MAIFRECKHSFQIVQALFGKSASTLVFSPAKVRNRVGSFGTFRVPRPSGDGLNAGGISRRAMAA